MLILYPVAALLSVGNTLLLLITNRDSAEESRTTGFTGKQVALIVHQNGSFGCAAGQGQSEAKRKYCPHNVESKYIGFMRPLATDRVFRTIRRCRRDKRSRQYRLRAFDRG